jgi:hypothetical protein
MTLCILLHFDSRAVGHKGNGNSQNGANGLRGISIRNDERLFAYTE